MHFSTPLLFLALAPSIIGAGNLFIILFVKKKELELIFSYFGLIISLERINASLNKSKTCILIVFHV